MSTVLPEKRITNFIKKHHVLTLATIFDNNVWCANCFYSYYEELNCLVFTSDANTKHIKDAIKNNSIAGSIVLETSVVGKIQGIQFKGSFLEPDKELLKKLKSNYLLRFPFAIISKTKIWAINLTYIKMTDNRLGFGKKLIWEIPY